MISPNNARNTTTKFPPLSKPSIFPSPTARNHSPPPSRWAFGLGHKGQTYIYERDGGFYESHLSFYKSLQALDLTTGHDASDPDDLKSAMGRWLDGDEARRCFGCHTTASRIAGHFDTSHLTPGVQCESCHGPEPPTSPR